MLEQLAARNIDHGYHRIEIITEMPEETLRRVHVGFDPEPL